MRARAEHSFFALEMQGITSFIEYAMHRFFFSLLCKLHIRPQSVYLAAHLEFWFESDATHLPGVGFSAKKTLLMNTTNYVAPLPHPPFLDRPLSGAVQLCLLLHVAIPHQQGHAIMVEQRQNCILVSFKTPPASLLSNSGPV